MMSFSVIIFSIISSIILFLIAKNGWNGSSRKLKIALIVSTFFASVMYTTPSVFQSEQNIQNNSSLLVNYYQLQLKCIEAINTYEQSGCKNDTILRNVLLSNYKVMSELQEVLIIIDAKSIKDPFSHIDQKLGTEDKIKGS